MLYIAENSNATPIKKEPTTPSKSRTPSKTSTNGTAGIAQYFSPKKEQSETKSPTKRASENGDGASPAKKVGMEVLSEFCFEEWFFCSSQLGHVRKQSLAYVVKRLVLVNPGMLGNG